MHVARLALALLVTTGCASSDPSTVQGPPLDAGHGGVEDVTKVLSQQGVPCQAAVPAAAPPGAEEAVTCRLTPPGESVFLVHFLNVEASQTFERETREGGDHGVYADTWAARTKSAEAAELIAAAVVNRGRS